MANLRDIKKRINSVQNTKQITRTMEMVATAKVRHSTERVKAAVPFTKAQVNTLLQVLLPGQNSINLPLGRVHDEIKRAIAIVVVSDRGLAGGFNSNILRMVEHYRSDNQAKGVETDVIVCGKRGVGYFTYRHIEPVMVFRDLSADPTMDEAREISTWLRVSYLNNEIDEARVFYNHARNAADQDLRDELILPITADMLMNIPDFDTEEAKGEFVSVSFEPGVIKVMNTLLEMHIDAAIYHALIDSAAAEQGARRKAMKSATDNATEMVSTLDRLYNRVRQGAITTEITEIVGGAAALEDE